MEVDQRATAVAGIDRRAGLNRAGEHDPLAFADVATQGADDPVGNAALKPQWVPLGENDLADGKLRRVGEVGGGDPAACPDIDDGQVVGHVGADEPSVEPPTVGQGDGELARAADYVGVCDDVALRVEDDPTAQTAVGLDLNHLGLSLLDGGHELLLDRCRR